LIGYHIIAWYLLGVQYSDCSLHFFGDERPYRGNHFSSSIDIREQLFFTFMVISRGTLTGKDLGEMRGERLGLFFVTSDSSLILLSENCVCGRLNFLLAFHRK